MHSEMKIRNTRLSTLLLYLTSVTCVALLFQSYEFALEETYSAKNGVLQERKIAIEDRRDFLDLSEQAFRCLVQNADISHTLRRIMGSEVKLTPYPHSIITEFFSPKIYSCILKHSKAMRVQRNLKRLSSNMSPKDIEQARRSYNELNTPSHLERIELVYNLKRRSKSFWQDFPALLNSPKVRNSLLQKFSDPLSLRVPKFEVKKSQTYSRQLLTIDSSSYAILPHTDTVDKLVTILVYLPEDTRAKSDLGTVLLQKKNSTQILNISGKQRAQWDDFEVVKQAPFQPNVALAFSACHESWHAVKEVEKMKQARISLQTFIMKKDMKGKEKVGPCSTLQKD